MCMWQLTLAMALVFFALSICDAQAMQWQCGASVNVGSEGAVPVNDAPPSWAPHQLQSPDAVDRLIAPDFADHPLRLSDIAFVPRVEADALDWMKRASQSPVEIAARAPKPDYLGRIPVLIRDQAKTSPITWQEALLSKGLALLMAETPGDLSRLITAEDDAISGGAGMWRDHGSDTAFYTVANTSDTAGVAKSGHADVADAIGRFVVVDGVVVSVENQEWRSYLNFGQNWRRDFTIAIGAELRDVLTSPDGGFDAWIGRKVRVRGVVENRGGPYIALQNINWLCLETQ